HDGQENSGGVAVDGSGNAYLTGQTSSTSFPTTPGAFSGNHNGGWGDAFLLKLNPAGGGSSDLLYSTYLGGSGPGDKGFDIDVDENGHAYAVGTTNSSNFTTTAGSYDTSLGGSADAFIVKLDPAGNGQADLLYGAFLGGDNGTETGYGLVVDGVDNVYITGETESDDFRTSVGAFDTSFNSGTHDAFFVRLEISDTVTLTATVDFDAFTYSVGEGDGLATVAVTLGVPSALTVTVDYATSDGTATAPGDYTTAGSTLTFMPGLTETTFTVAINDDELVENNETLILTLSNAVNANIGDNNPATLTIIDNDDPPSGERLPFYSTFLGGSGDDTGDDVAVDGDGDAYVFGTTTSADFPVSVGIFSDTLIGGQDDFVFKIHPAGDGTNDRVYATYIGGSAGDSAGGITVDGAENVYITGWSNNFFPDTPGSFASCDDGGAFVTKLNDTGTALLYSGCLAGINAEGQDITLDSTGQAYVSGKTGNTFLTTSGAYQETYGGGVFDAFLAIVSTDGVTLTYATYLGGNDDECIGSTSGCTLDLDSSDNVYLAGDTESANFPTQNAYDSTCGTDGSCDSSRDVFLAKLNPAGGGASDLLYSTFIGHDGQENGGGVAVDGSGNAYLTGQTSSTSFPTTPGAYSESHNGGWGDAFLLKLNPAGGGSSDLLYSTYLGGSGPTDKGFDVAVDENNHAYAVGTTNSSNFPTTPGSYDTSLGSTTDAFVVKLNPAGNGQADLLYGAFLGGDNGTETGYALVADGEGNIYVTGETTADDFPTSVGAFDRTFDNGNHDAFFVRLSTAKLYIYLPLVLRSS
ncbi:MAG: hypothetical protein GY832_45660, partial [Chloroflexi bacterium]|nr:hypothetical protein [Chloroflexota bacterium]